MKHTLPVSLLLIGIFLVSQIVGLAVINKDANVNVLPSGEIEVTHKETALGERPEIKGGTTTAYILGALIIGTLILLVLIKYQKFVLWKLWYFTAVWATLTITIGVFLLPIPSGIIALILAVLKMYRPNLIVHNVTEVMMYSGIALLFVPLLDVKWMIVILLLVALYDAYAVWKSKHMIKMARFTMDSKVFAGLAIPYKGERITAKAGRAKGRTAILGGGDVAFPLMFSGVVMEWLMQEGVSKLGAFYESLFIVAFATAAVAYLLLKGEKGKFYPAMPFITAGCIIGYLIILLL
ncbi:MAG TPA: presenilin family intramembrane aspartyl protease [Candidatus Nanoarchaeia archaeon]|nr:presenilin family intramembrane aspartyl protease [Candidatus Nanoarchaeia archaeon]